MKILLNFLPLKTGGGVQVALDFLKQAELYGTDHEWYLVARRGTPFESYNDTDFIKSATFINDSILSRLYFEYFSCKPLIKNIEPDVIYTQFGPHWPGAKSLKNVVGCAYSNLFYPEIDFWAGYTFLKRVKRKIFDFVRLNRLKKADFVIFETKDLAERSINQQQLDSEKVSYVLPAVSSNVSLSTRHKEMADICQRFPQGFKLCLISGYSINKNFEVLIETLLSIKNKYERSDIYFVFTLDKSSEVFARLMKRADDIDVRDNILNIGSVPFDGCSEVYRACDAAILPANLESFSNNIAESWGMKKPLLITDLDWAHSLCGDGAIYIDHTAPENIADSIVKLSENQNLRETVVKAGSEQLSIYPDSKVRFLRNLSILEEVAGS